MRSTGGVESFLLLRVLDILPSSTRSETACNALASLRLIYNGNLFKMSTLADQSLFEDCLKIVESISQMQRFMNKEYCKHSFMMKAMSQVQFFSRYPRDASSASGPSTVAR